MLLIQHVLNILILIMKVNFIIRKERKLKKLVNNWAVISVLLGLVTLGIMTLSVWNFTQKIILALAACMFFHFYEEFGFPGGFPYMGVKVLLGRDELDQTKWSANNLSSLFGNWGALFMLYILPLFIPGLRFLSLAAVLFAFLECFMHLVLFNVKQRSFYNPGLVTAVFGMTPIAVFYFLNISKGYVYTWYDYVLALLWCVVVFVFFFRSPIYWKLGSIEGYPFTEQAAFGLEKKKLDSISE